MRSLRQLMSLMICSTSHRQRGAGSSALVGGQSCTCILYFLEPFVVVVLHFMVYCTANCNWSILSFFFLSSPPPPPPPPVSLFCEKLWRLFFYLNNLFYITIIISANNDCFAVLCSKYFSACDWRLIWCQSVADVTVNSGGFPNQQHFVHCGHNLPGLS